MSSRGFDLIAIGFEGVKAQHEALLSEILQVQRHAIPEAEERRRFFRMYRIRNILFRVSPGLAARLAL